MFRLYLLLSCLIVIEGKPLHKHAHTKKSKAISNIGPESSSPQSQYHSKRQVTNIHNIQVMQTDSTKEVAGNLGPHSASVTMVGPGSVSLNTQQMPREHGTPDHTLRVIDDKTGCSSCHTFPSAPRTPQNEPHPPELQPSEPSTQPTEDKHKETGDVKTESREPAKALVHTKEENAHHPAQKTTKTDIQQLSATESNQKPSQHKAATDERESTANHHESSPHHKSDKPNVVVHTVHLSGSDQPQDIYHQMDPNSIGVSMQGPGTVDLTTWKPNISHDVVYDPCPAENCKEQRHAKDHKE